jgi:hypothetical protein
LTVLHILFYSGSKKAIRMNLYNQPQTPFT